MTLTSADIEAFHSVVPVVHRFSRAASVTRLATPLNLDEEKSRIVREAASGVLSAPEFRFREPSVESGSLITEAALVLRTANQLPDGWRDAVIATVSDRLAQASAMSSHSAAEISAATEGAFGRPSPDLVAIARHVLAAPIPIEEAPAEVVDADAAREFFANAIAQGPLSGWTVEVVPNKFARAAVLSNRRTVELSAEATFSPRELDRLLTHELGSHALRSQNARLQRLDILATPLGVAPLTEEGLALVNEVRVNRVETHEFRKYALRVLAADTALRGSFTDVLEALLPHTDAGDAVDIACRAKRGMRDPEAPGAHLKDISYLAGYLEVEAHLAQQPDDYDLLMSVKQPLEMMPLVRELEVAGWVDRWPALVEAHREAGRSAGEPPIEWPSPARERPGAGASPSSSTGDLVQQESTGVLWRERSGRTQRSGTEVAATIASHAEVVKRQVIHMSDLTLSGDLDLDGMTLEAPIEFSNCTISGTILARNANLAALTLTDCRVDGLDLSSASITGDLTLVRTEIGTGSGTALRAVHARIGGNFTAAKDSDRQVCRFHGGIDGDFAEIAGRLDLSGAEITGSPRDMLRGTVSNVALMLTRAKVLGGIRLRTVQVSGMVRAIGVMVEGQVNLTEMRIANPGAAALVMERCRVSASMLLRGAQIEGAVKLAGSHIAGAFRATGVRMSAPASGLALSLNSVVCEYINLQRCSSDYADVDLDPAVAQIEGQVSIRSAEIERSIELDHLSVSATSIALDLSGSRVGGHVRGHGLRLSAVSAESREGEPGGKAVALAADALATGEWIDFEGSHLDGDVILDNLRAGAMVRLARCEFTRQAATVSASGAHVDGNLEVEATRFAAGSYVRLAGARIDGVFRWKQVTSPPKLDLDAMSVRLLDDDVASWPRSGGLSLRGFDYQQFADHDSSSAAVKRRIAWVDLQHSFVAAPYERLAAFYRAQSNEAASKQVMLALQRAQVRDRRSPLRRAMGWAWYALTGYGYRLSGIVAVSAIVLAISIGAAFWAKTNDAVTAAAADPSYLTDLGGFPVASECTSDYPCFDPVVFGLDAVVPVIEFNQEQYWVPDRSTTDGYLYDKLLQILTVLGWISLSVVAGGLVQRIRN